MQAQMAPNRITVLGDAYEEVTANEVTVLVELSYDDDKDAQVAYQEHQDALQQLTTLLEDSKVAKGNIRFLPLQSRKGQNFRQGQPAQQFTTYQQVLIDFNDLGQYDQVQRLLMTSGFSDLMTDFSVSNEREIEMRLMDEALARAKEKASRLAKASSRSIKRIVSMSDVGESENLYGYREYSRRNPYQQAVNYENDPVRQMKISPRVFKFAAAVKVVYELED